MLPPAGAALEKGRGGGLWRRGGGELRAQYVCKGLFPWVWGWELGLTVEP